MSLAVFLACCALASIVAACVTYVVTTIIAAIGRPHAWKRAVVELAADLAKVEATLRTHVHPMPLYAPWMAMAERDRADSDGQLAEVDDYYDPRRGRLFAALVPDPDVYNVAEDPDEAAPTVVTAEERALLAQWADDPDAQRFVGYLLADEHQRWAR